MFICTIITIKIIRFIIAIKCYIYVKIVLKASQITQLAFKNLVVLVVLVAFIKFQMIHAQLAVLLRDAISEYELR